MFIKRPGIKVMHGRILVDFLKPWITSDHVGCFRFADWLILWFKMAATEWKFVT